MKNTSASRAAMIACLTAALAFGISIVRADAPDTSTPKKAALVFAKAVEAGDLATAKSVSTGSDSDWAIVKMMSDGIVALKGLSAAAADKFGDQGKLPPGMTIELASQFENSDEKIDGDNATLISRTKPDDKFPPQLKKTANGWVLDLANLGKDPSSAGMVQLMPVMIKVFTAVTADIKTGKYATMQDAMTAFNQSMRAALSAAGIGGPPGSSAPQ